MLFSSTVFICAFFPLFFLLYYLLPGRTAKNYLLLAFSLFFYAWGEPLYLSLLLLAALVGWLCGLLIGKCRKRGKIGCARLALLLGVIYNLGMLCVFKYADFLVISLNGVTGLELMPPGIALPIGISFFTFQILSYIIDVYRGDVAPQHSFGIVAVYLCAFPQLIAGPIVRYKTIETQLTERTVAADDIYRGLRRFIVGLAKKVLIANNIAVVADNLLHFEAAELGIVGAWLTVAAYTLQIYFDFSGYSDMAIGMGRMMGFRYLENFDDPYTARSVTDFWRRWHISLSSYFRDYVYIPLGGNRVSGLRWVFNIAVVWALTGLWHGASWNFILWGVYYGVLLLLEKLLWGKSIERVPVVRNIYTMLAVMLGWTLFRAGTLTQAGQLYAAMLGRFGMGAGELSIFAMLRRSEAGGMFFLAMLFGVLLSTPIPRLLRARLRDGGPLRAVTDVLALALLIASIVSIASGAYNPFIYFRF